MSPLRVFERKKLIEKERKKCVDKFIINYI